MTDTEQIVLSASRRSDIPAFYMDWFMDQIGLGRFEVTNPYNGRVSIVPASAGHVHTIVFWSKDFGPFIRGGHGPRLERMGYHLFFNFTVNSESPLLEALVPPLEERLRQLARLCRDHGAESVQWRFDPICCYTVEGQPGDNLADFAAIADAAAASGVRRCVTSFMDDYPKIRRRTATLPRFSFVDPGIERKQSLLLRLGSDLDDRGIALLTCCETGLLRGLPAASNAAAGACIPSDLLMTLYGGRLSLKPDPGQRRGQGCGCRVSRDIGDYRQHPCFHRCLYCYANPATAGAGTDMSTNIECRNPKFTRPRRA